MLDSEYKLLEYNNNGILSHILAIEEHLAQLDSSEINDSWCIVKHSKLASSHHFIEAVNHSYTISPTVSKSYAKLKAEFDEISKRPTLAKVRMFRNKFRQFMNDPTLANGCPLCGLDTHGAVLIEAETAITAGETNNKGKYLAIGAIALMIGVPIIYGIVRNRRR